MKSFEFESADICTKVLVIKQKGKISAIGNKCSHYGALLSMGVLGDGRVRCPWYEKSLQNCQQKIIDFYYLQARSML